MADKKSEEEIERMINMMILARNIILSHQGPGRRGYN